MSRRKLPPDQEVVRLVQDEGLTYQQVAARFGCTRQAVGLAMTNAGARSTRGAEYSYREWIPWTGVAPEHNNDLLVRMLRLHARDQIGLELSPAQQRRLEEWKDYMDRRGAVVLYDRALGFRLAPRRPGELGYARPAPDPVG